MANYCFNVLTIKAKKGNEAELQRFINNFIDKKGNARFEKIIPLPKGYFKGNLGKEEREKYGEKNWYDFNIANYGTKWSPYKDSTHLSFNDRKTIAWVGFDTAWSPCISFVENASVKYPSLDFKLKYKEEGMCFKGTAHIVAGEILEDKCINY